MFRRFLSALAPGVIIVSGCYMAVPTRVDIELTMQDGAVWVEPEQMPRYGCLDGLLVCTDGVGRLTRRLCRCVEP